MLFDAKFVTHTDIYRHKKCLTIDPNSTFVDVTCAVRRKDSLCALARWFCVSRKGRQGEVGGVTRLSVEMPWLALGGPILALFAQIGLENTALTL